MNGLIEGRPHGLDDFIREVCDFLGKGPRKLYLVLVKAIHV